MVGMHLRKEARKAFKDVDHKRGSALAGLGAGGSEPRYVVWLSSTCSSCVGAAASIGEAPGKARHRNLLGSIGAVLISGSGPSIDEMKAALAPVADRIIVDPQASRLATELVMPFTPFVLATDEDFEKVLGWTDFADMQKLDRLDETLRVEVAGQVGPAPVAVPAVGGRDAGDGHQTSRQSAGTEERA
jgi:hypothetical protein